MKRNLLTLCMAIAVAASTCYAEDVTYGVKLADAKGKQADAKLILEDSHHDLLIRVSGRDFVDIPYDHLDKFSYEYTKKHRITQGAIVMVASLGAGAVVMMTKSKSHWLYVDYHDGDAPKTIVLRMEKGQYKKICNAVEEHTGKTVQYEGDAKEAKKA
jgi:hypothetical protein